MGDNELDDSKKKIHRAIPTIAQSISDDKTKSNADFASKSGMTPKIIRKTSGSSCGWCTSQAGTYEYPAKQEVYQRHDNCDCTVEYIVGKKRQNVWIKKVVQITENYNEDDIRIVINDRIEDVTEKYKKRPKDKDGSLIIEQGTDIDDQEIANWIYDIFGGDVKCLAEQAQVGKMPDAIWNGVYWEFKRPTTLSAVDARIRKSQEQLMIASERDNIGIGGIVLDISDAKESTDAMVQQIINKTKSRCKAKQDVIIKYGNEMIMVIRFR